MKSAVDLYELDTAKHGLENLKPLLVAIEEVERWAGVYQLSRSALLVMGGLCWLVAALPHVSARPRALVLGLWAVVLGLLVISIAAGHLWRRRCERYRVARVLGDSWSRR